MANPQVVVDFIANTSGLAGGLRDAEGASGGLKDKLKSLGKTALIAGGAAGLAALGATLKIGIDELTQASKVSAQTAAVIKSTGGAAGVTAKQVKDLAGALMLKTGIDDETIQSGENLLLTFRNVQNQAGKGNDIFTQATKTMLDMSVALGQDTSTSAIQLGKALNDPIKGVAQLHRVGVNFTDAQKAQIDALVKSGHTMQAQKIILGELNKEFGGSAAAAGKTLPGQLNILKESFRNLAGQIVGLLAPALATVTKFFVEHPALAKAMVIAVLALSAAMVALNVALAVTAALEASILLPILAIVAGFAALVAIVVLVVKNWDTLVGVMTDGFDAIKRAAQDVLKWLNGAWQAVEKTITDPIKSALQWVGNAWGNIKSTIQSVVGATLGWLKSNWMTIVGILTGPIGIAVTQIIQHWDTIKSATQSAFTAVGNAVWAGIHMVQNAIDAAWNAMKSVINAFTSAKESAWDLFGKVGDAVWAGIHTVQNAIAAAWDAMRTIVNAFEFAKEWAWQHFGAVGDAVWSGVHTVMNAIGWVGDQIWGFIRGTWTNALQTMGGVFHFVIAGANAAKNAVVGIFNDLVGFIWSIIDRVRGAASSVADAIKAPINTIIRGWNSLSFKVPSVNIPSVKILGHKIGGGSLGGFTIGFPNIPLLAAGGVVDQPTLAMVGEGTGREIVAPENLLRDIVGSQAVEVHVYIGQQELTDLVDTQVYNANTGLARSLLAGGVA